VADPDKTQIIGSFRAQQASPDAVLVCLTPDAVSGGAPVIELTGDAVLLGRGGDSDAVVDAPGVAEAHARFTPQAGAWAVEVVAGADPVTVNRSSVHRAFLKPGDTIGIGDVRYAFRTAGEAEDADEAPTEFNSTLVMDAATAGRIATGKPPAAGKPRRAAPAPASAPAAAATPSVDAQSARAPASAARGPLMIAGVVVLAAIAAAVLWGLLS